MQIRTTHAIDAELEALKARMRRLRLERKMAALAESERKLLALAKRKESELCEEK